MRKPMPRHLSVEAGALTALRHLHDAAMAADPQDTLAKVVADATQRLLEEIEESARAEQQ